MDRSVRRSITDAGWVIGASVLSVFLTVPHNIEDIAYGVPARFGLDSLTAGIALGGVYGLQVLAAAQVGAGRREGYWLNLALAAFWFLGSVFDHSLDVFSPSPFRGGMVSRVIALGVMFTALAWLITSGRALWPERRTDVGMYG